MKGALGEPKRHGMLPFMVHWGDEEAVTGRVGLTLVVEALRALRVDKLTGAKLKMAKRRRGFSEYEKLEALILLIAAGGERVEDIRVLQADRGLLRLLGQQLPSPDVLLVLLNGFHDEETWKSRPEGTKAWVPPESPLLAALFEIHQGLVARAADPGATTATIDHDGTIVAAHKREALVAYEGTRGYQPLVAVWVEEDLIVGDEFRDGNVPGNMDPLSSVQRAFAVLPNCLRKRYFRGDSADYYEALLKYLVKEEIIFSISADVSPQLRASCTSVAEKDWVELEQREQERVHVSEIEFAPGEWPKNAKPLRYVAIRFTPLQGELLPREGDLFGATGQPASGLKYLAVVTNRPAFPTDATEKAPPDAMSPTELVRWHWQKAGTIEHVHRSMKDELGAGVLPSQKFGANAAWFRINAMTYNVLTFLKRRALPERFREARPKRLRFEVFELAGRLTSHQRQLTVDAATGKVRVEELISARRRLVDFHDSLSPQSLIGTLLTAEP
jgi:Transposase DDE domain group 1